MGSGYAKMKKQARMMQEQMEQKQEKLKSTFVEGNAGNGLVTITLNGAKDLKKIAIHPDCLSDSEGLEDLILAAFADAASRLEEDDSMPNLGSGMSNLFA